MDPRRSTTLAEAETTQVMARGGWRAPPQEASPAAACVEAAMKIRHKMQALSVGGHPRGGRVLHRGLLMAAACSASIQQRRCGGLRMRCGRMQTGLAVRHCRDHRRPGRHRGLVHRKVQAGRRRHRRRGGQTLGCLVCLRRIQSATSVAPCRSTRPQMTRACLRAGGEFTFTKVR